MTIFFVSKCWPNYYTTNLSDLKHNFEFLCHIRGVNVPDCTRHHLICSRFFFSVLLQCFKIIFNNLILHSIFYRFSHHSFVLGRLYLLLLFFSWEKVQDSKFAHFSRLLQLSQKLHDLVRNYTIRSKITRLSQKLHN